MNIEILYHNSEYLHEVRSYKSGTMIHIESDYAYVINDHKEIVTVHIRNVKIKGEWWIMTKWREKAVLNYIKG